MKLITTLSAAALVIALGFSATYAQSPGSEQGAAEPSANPPSMAPSQGAGKAPDIAPTGPSTRAIQEGQVDPSLTRPKGGEPSMSAEGDGKPEGNARKKAEGSDGKSEGNTRTKAEGKDDPDTVNKAGAKAEGKGDRESGETSSRAEGDTGASGKTGRTAEDQKPGKSGKSVRLESQQVSKMRTYFSQNKPRVKAIDKDRVSVSIGIALPGTIALYDLPPNVIVVGGPCPIKYFVWGDDIVLVDSCTREVVEVIVGVA